jgi:hypothetical protein
LTVTVLSSPIVTSTPDGIVTGSFPIRDMALLPRADDAWGDSAPGLAP